MMGQMGPQLYCCAHFVLDCAEERVKKMVSIRPARVRRHFEFARRALSFLRSPLRSNDLCDNLFHYIYIMDSSRMKFLRGRHGRGGKP